MVSLHITVLGEFSVTSARGEPIVLKGRKTQALLACLAMNPGAMWGRDKLTGLLWSERADEQARGSLRQALSELRKAFHGLHPDPLKAQRDAVSLDTGSVESDVARFINLAADDASPVALEQAAELYKGELLDGLGGTDPAFEEWLDSERRNLNERAQGVLSALLDHQKTSGALEQAIATARRLLAIDPLQETVHRTLMSLYVTHGERTMALKQYQACRDVLKNELGIAPSAETETLHTKIRQGNDATQSETRPLAIPLALPDKPSIAVLPFTNISGDAEQEYFADGITEDIITELSRFHSLFVIARNSSFTFKGQAVDVIEVGKALGVQYIVEGSVRKAGNRVRITAQLAKAETGNHIWAERYDRELGDIFDLQDELVRMIVSIVDDRIIVDGKLRASRMQDSNVRAYDLCLRAAACEDGNTKEDYQRARQYLNRAIEIDPGLAMAFHRLSLVDMMVWMAHWEDDRSQTFANAMKAEKTAATLDDTDSRVQGQLGLLHLCSRKFEEAAQYFEKALRLNPNDYQAKGLYGFYLAATGYPDQSLEQFDLAARLNPLEPYWIRWLRGIANFTAERFEDSINDFISIAKPFNEVRGWLAASYAHAGRIDEARTTLQEFLQTAEQEMITFPGHRVGDWESYWHGAIQYQNEADFQRLYDGLRKAGMSSHKER